MKFWLLLFVAINLCLLRSYAQPPLISTVVGNGSPMHSGDGGPATAASACRAGVSRPDKNGNYYISERFCHTIRKISVSGIITTIAGTGTSGYSGDNGPATAAQLNNPAGLALDTFGNLFIAEIEGARVRKIDMATGIISTYAGNGVFGYADSGDGGPATSAMIYGVVDLCLDRRENLYITSGVGVIRKVDISTGIITTVAGYIGGYCGFIGDGGPATNAKFCSPHGICTDTVGNLFIADGRNNRIRRVDLTTGIITTIAGDDSVNYNGDGIPATTARLGPSDIEFDHLGNLIITDDHNNRIRKISTDGTIHTIAGIGIAGYSGDGGRADSAKIWAPQSVSVDDCNNVLFNDNINARIRKITFPQGNAPTVTISAATGNNLCYAMPVTFTANTMLAGRAPTYQWKVNGANVGSSAPTYTYTPSNGDSIQCVLTSSLYCVVNPMDTSNTLHMTVGTHTPPTISITGDTVKGAGTTVNLAATISGTTGTYMLHWKNHGIEFAATTIPAVSYIKATGTDSITVALVSMGRGCYDSVVSGNHLVYDHNLSILSGMVHKGIETSFHPNPVGDVLSIKSDALLERVDIINLLGRLVLASDKPTGGHEIEVNVSGLVSGVYFVRVNGRYCGEIVKR